MSIESPSFCLCLTLCHIDGSPHASVRCLAEVFICVLLVFVVQLKNTFLVKILNKYCQKTGQNITKDPNVYQKAICTEMSCMSTKQAADKLCLDQYLWS